MTYEVHVIYNMPNILVGSFLIENGTTNWIGHLNMRRSYLLRLGKSPLIRE
jgi:hypothetical protein